MVESDNLSEPVRQWLDGLLKSAPVHSPDIIVNNRQLLDVVQDAWDVLLRSPVGPHLYLRNRWLVIEHQGETNAVSATLMRVLLNRYANWIRIERGRRQPATVPGYLPRDMLVWPSERVQEV